VGDEAFKELLAYLERGYTLPGRRHFTGALHAKYNEVCEKLYSRLVLGDSGDANVDSIRFTYAYWLLLD